MSTPYKDLELSFHELLILCYIKVFRIKRTFLNTKPRYSFLIKYSLVDYWPKDHQYYIINDKGKMLLRYRRKDRFRFWIPVIISIVALLGGYNIYTIEPLAQILQTTMQLLKTILGSLGISV